MTLNLLRVCSALAFALTLSSCFKVGNDLNGTCTRGDSCICDIIGNCSRSCPGGGCEFECKGTGNCNFDCAGGSCNALCENTGNCILDCAGGNCSVSCMNTGNCINTGALDLSTPIIHDFSSVD